MMYDNSSVYGALFIFYVVLAISLWKMAERTKQEPQWYALVPILDLLLLVRIAGKPDWWTILFFVPLANIVVFVLVTMAVCVRFGISKWAGLLAIISPVNMILYLYLAFGTKTVAAVPSPAAPKIPDIKPPPPPPAA